MVSWQGLLASTDRLLSSWEEGQEEALGEEFTPILLRCWDVYVLSQQAQTVGEMIERFYN
jgi:hypothetical protein